MHSQFCLMSQYSIFSRDPLIDEFSNSAFLEISHKQFFQVNRQDFFLLNDFIFGAVLHPFSLKGLKEVPVKGSETKKTDLVHLKKHFYLSLDLKNCIYEQPDFSNVAVSHKK